MMVGVTMIVAFGRKYRTGPCAGRRLIRHNTSCPSTSCFVVPRPVVVMAAVALLRPGLVAVSSWRRRLLRLERNSWGRRRPLWHSTLWYRTVGRIGSWDNRRGRYQHHQQRPSMSRDTGDGTRGDKRCGSAAVGPLWSCHFICRKK
jgi:hypothetical protein